MTDNLESTNSSSNDVVQRVSLRHEENVAIIRMDDSRGNALSKRMLLELEAAIDTAASAGAVLLLGRKRIFCAGLDLFEIAPYSESEILDFLDLLHRVRRKIYAFDRPLVVAVAGSAIGAGASIVCCGDTRMGIHDCGSFSFPEVRFGVTPLASTLEIIRNTLSPSDAASVLLFGESFGSAEALAMGMLHQLVEPDRLESIAMTAAVKASALSSAAVPIKHALRQDALQRMDETRAESHEAFAAAWGTDETHGYVADMLRRLEGARNA
jgi:enoyl-CoA hydratase